MLLLKLEEYLMRIALALAGISALVFAGAAAAVTVSPVSYSPAFERALAHDLGEREGTYLSSDLTRAIEGALARHGVAGGAGSIEVSIVYAAPNRPTFDQLGRQPQLDPARSISLGGAELHALIKAPDGHTVAEVFHNNYDMTLLDVARSSPTTWTAAERAINQFAEKVAVAYAAQSGGQ